MVLEHADSCLAQQQIPRLDGIGYRFLPFCIEVFITRRPTSGLQMICETVPLDGVVAEDSAMPQGLAKCMPRADFDFDHSVPTANVPL